MADKKSLSPEKPVTPETQSDGVEKIFRLLTNLERFAWDVLGVFFLALAMMTCLALFFPVLAGGLLAWWAGNLQLWLGWGSLWAVLSIGALGLALLRRNMQNGQERVLWGRILMLELAAFASLALLAVMGGSSLERAEAGMDGGRIGWGLVLLLNMPFNAYGAASVIWTSVVAGLIMLFGLISGLGLFRPLITWAKRNNYPVSEFSQALHEMDPAVSEAPVNNAAQPDATPVSQRKRRASLPPQFRKNFRVQSDQIEKPISAPQRDERLPSLDLLVNGPFNRPDERNINLTAGLIEKTLSEFGIPAHVVGFRVGPTVTQFAVEPGYVEKDKPGAGRGCKPAESPCCTNFRPGTGPGLGVSCRQVAD